MSRLQKRILCWVAADDRRRKGVIASRHQELVRALQGDQGHLGHRLHTLEGRHLLVIGRSPGGNADYLSLTPEGPKWALRLAGSGDDGIASGEP